MTEEQKREEYLARHERLQRVANNIDRGIGSRFYGADFQLGFNYMYGEIVVLQKEFNERFNKNMKKEMALSWLFKDAAFTEFYDRIIQIMESSETVLLDSISPAKNKKAISERVANLKKSAEDTKK